MLFVRKPGIPAVACPLESRPVRLSTHPVTAVSAAPCHQLPPKSSELPLPQSKLPHSPSNSEYRRSRRFQIFLAANLEKHMPGKRLHPGARSRSRHNFPPLPHKSTARDFSRHSH